MKRLYETGDLLEIVSSDWAEYIGRRGIVINYEKMKAASTSEQDYITYFLRGGSIDNWHKQEDVKLIYRPWYIVNGFKSNG